MELMKNLKFICRVCGTDTRASSSSGGIGKKSSSTSNSAAASATTAATATHCIFKTHNLKEKLEKYLFLRIASNDQLPKKICSLCYRKICSLEVFAETAKKTENFLNDFIQISQNNLLNTPAIKTHFQDEFIYYAMLANMNSNQAENDPLVAEDVVLNVSLSEPLTSDIGKEIIKAQRQKQAILSQRRNSTVSRDVTIERSYKKQSQSLKRQNLKNIINKQCVSETTVRPVPECEQYMATPTPPTLPVQISVRQFAKDPDTATDSLNLGSVIKDLDLLKLILKALKWPFNEHTLPTQIERLKSTRFRDVMVDPNLLQDTDMMQILSSYLGPILQQSPQQAALASLPPPLTPLASKRSQQQPPFIPPGLAYKLPAETSIQVISVVNDEDANCDAPAPMTVIHGTKKRRRPKTKPPIEPSPPVILVSDDSNLDNDIQRFEVSIDPMSLFANGDSSNSNEAMLAHLNAQRKRLMEKQRSLSRSIQKQARKRKPSLSSVTEIINQVSTIIDVEDLDDMEITMVDKAKPSTTTKAIIEKIESKDVSTSMNQIGFKTYPAKKRIVRESMASTSKDFANTSVQSLPGPSTSKAVFMEVESSEDVDDEPRLVIDVDEDIVEEVKVDDVNTKKDEPVQFEDKQIKTFADADSTTKNCNRDITLIETVNIEDDPEEGPADCVASQSNVAAGNDDHPASVEEDDESTEAVVDTSVEEQNENSDLTLDEDVDLKMDDDCGVIMECDLISQKMNTECVDVVENTIAPEVNKSDKTLTVAKTRGRKPKLAVEPSVDSTKESKKIKLEVAIAEEKAIKPKDRVTRHRQLELKKLQIEMNMPELGRNPRLSKTYSKYYKGPEKPTTKTAEPLRASTRLLRKT